MLDAFSRLNTKEQDKILNKNRGINFSKLSLGERYKSVMDIMLDIYDGKRRHNQAQFHSVVRKNDQEDYEASSINDCETAHCIAGWMSVEYLNSIGENFYEIESKKIDEAKEEMIYDNLDDGYTIGSALLTSNYYVEQEKYEDSYQHFLDLNGNNSADTWAWAASVLQLDYEDSYDIFSEDYKDIEELIHNLVDLTGRKFGHEVKYKVLGITKEQLKNI